jgi:molybdate transport system permease protein
VSGTGAALALSLFVATCSSILILPVAASIGYGLQREKLGTAARWLTSLPLSLPPLATGVLLLWLFSPLYPPGALLHRLGLNPILTIYAAVLASALVSLPLVVQACEAAWAGFPEEAMSEARGLGATPRLVWMRIALPQLAPGFLRAFLIGFQRSLGEFGATLLVAGSIPGRTQTLPLALFAASEGGRTSEAAQLLGWSLLLALVCVALTQGLERRWRREKS